MTEDDKIHAQVSSAADQILLNLGNECKGDVPIGLAALALAMCCLARVEGVPLSDLEQLLWIAHEQTTAVPDSSLTKRVRQ